MSVYDKYETVIGLEVHIQLSTASKAFCGDDARFGGSPNTHVSAISLGHPGTLPRLNRKQVEYAVRLGLALGCEINPTNFFDRKNYFYADLPKGYQITQDKQPICLGGSLEIPTENRSKKIRIHHIHMEEDAGKSIHDLDPLYSKIDLNRAGVPLLELVTEPDLRSPEEVYAFMGALRQIVRYLDISDGNMEEGSFRCDCNVSVRLKGSTRLGQRCEIKNINSMRFARRAATYEVRRQTDIIESGGSISQQTLNFDPATGVTTPLRDKEYAHDYRYFPDPDLPPVVLSEAYIADIRAGMPPLPQEILLRLTRDHGLSDYDATLIAEEKQMALYFTDLLQHTPHTKAAANLFINKIMPYLSEHQLSPDDFPVSMSQLSSFIQLIQDGKVSKSIAYQRLFRALIQSPETPPESLAEKLNLIQEGDEDFLENLIKETMEKNPDKVAAYRKGKKNLIGFFMGEIMKASRGKADPKATNQLLRKKLGES